MAVMASPQLKALTRKLECPVCFEVPSGEIFNCQTGHSICSRCSLLIDTCGMCQQPMTASRNFVMETLIEELKREPDAASEVECPNKSEGCKIVVPADQMWEHKKDCEFRPIRCLYGKGPICPPTPIKLSQYFNHLFRSHKIPGDTSTIGIFNKVDRCGSESFRQKDLDQDWPIYSMNFDGQMFLRFCCIRSGIFYYWIKLIGPQQLCSQYTARILIRSPRPEPSFSAEWKVPIYPLGALESVILSDPHNPAMIDVWNINACPSPEIFRGFKYDYNWNCQIVLTRVA